MAWRDQGARKVAEPVSWILVKKVANRPRQDRLGQPVANKRE